MGVSELYQMTNRLPTELPWLTVAKYFEKVDSTQNRITQFLPKDPTGAVAIIAESQSKGVGREGRAWVSAPGGIWMTVGFPLSTLPLASVPAFSLVSAHLVVKALKEVNNLECELKWPNDVLYQGKKLGGILLTTTTKFKKSWVLIGLGINVNNPITGELAKTATSIAEIRKQSQGRSRLIEAILTAFNTAWSDWSRTGFGPYQKSVLDHLVGLGKSVQLKMGTKTIQGTMKSVDPQGNLLLESDAGIKTVQAGEIVGQPA